MLPPCLGCRGYHDPGKWSSENTFLFVFLLTTINIDILVCSVLIIRNIFNWLYKHDISSISDRLLCMYLQYTVQLYTGSNRHVCTISQSPQIVYFFFIILRKIMLRSLWSGQALPCRVVSLLLLRNRGRYTKPWAWCRFSILRISGERRKWRKGKLCLQNTRKYFCDFITLRKLILSNSHFSLWTGCQSIILSV